MQPETFQRTLTRPEMNSIKNKMALAFMHALNSTVNYHFEESGRDMDGLGVDLTLVSQTVGTNRTIASGANEIKVQLKGVATSSATMFRENETHITYTLSRDLVRFGLSMYLIIVVLPDASELENWRTVTNENVLLTARAYYYKVEDRVTRGRIQIPKTQQLNVESYKQLFEDITEEVQL